MDGQVGLPVQEQIERAYQLTAEVGWKVGVGRKPHPLVRYVEVVLGAFGHLDCLAHSFRVLHRFG